MSKINSKSLIAAFSELGKQLIHPDEEFRQIINTEHIYNSWFTPESVAQAVTATGISLNDSDLSVWVSRYDLAKSTSPKKIGLILAGNIPLVGFHDVLCVLVTGNHALIKASSQDARLIKHVLGKLVAIDGRFADQFSFVERLVDFDAVIATGSNNSSRYFEYYFSKVPHIIRKNRNSVALITGTENPDQLYNLGHDIFDYFGLGCRNVSKLMIPKGYNLARFLSLLSHITTLLTTISMVIITDTIGQYTL
ncbi:acyl-CoA reductase [Mucilaginibacter antarcticus]|uniref:acyl-CoA reductase n=1 Tax=Mucilaginibacter antarcticus TaxID=1855725 RepID=UPI00362BE957